MDDVVGFHPFVVAVSRDQAATFCKRAFEGWFFGDRFTASVDHATADGQVVRPRRHEAPAGIEKLLGVIGRGTFRMDATDACDVLRGRDVVPSTIFTWWDYLLNLF